MRLKLLSIAACAAVLASACQTAAAPTPTTAPKPAAATAAPAVTTAPAAPAASPAAAAPTTASAASPVAAAPAITIAGPLEGEAKNLDGAGATFPGALYSKWFNEYEKITGVKVNYQAIGSGGGIKAVQDQTVDFGGTDSPMTNEQIAAAKGGEVFHIPAALGAVVPTYNITGVASTVKLKFTGETLAGIYLGTITKWNDPKLVADNTELASVNQDIVVVHRSDGSGTTSIWVDYLSTVSKDWETKVGRGTAVNWPSGIGASGNAGVAGEIKQQPNSIGYVELIYAIQNKLGVGMVKNKAGKFVEPTLDGVAAAAASVANTIAPDLRVSIVDAPGDTTYPISGFTWLLVYKNMPDKAKATAVTRLAWWAIHDAQKFNADLGYAPVPAGIVTKAEGMIRTVTTGGAPAFPGR